MSISVGSGLQGDESLSKQIEGLFVCDLGTDDICAELVTFFMNRHLCLLWRMTVCQTWTYLQYSF